MPSDYGSATPAHLEAVYMLEDLVATFPGLPPVRGADVVDWLSVRLDCGGPLRRRLVSSLPAGGAT